MACSIFQGRKSELSAKMDWNSGANVCFGVMNILVLVNRRIVFFGRKSLNFHSPLPRHPNTCITLTRTSRTGVGWGGVLNIFYWPNIHHRVP